MIFLLVDSEVLPIYVEDYVVEIQKAFGSFMAHYQEDLHKANLSIGMKMSTLFIYTLQKRQSL